MDTKTVMQTPAESRKGRWIAPFSLASLVVAFFGAQIFGSILIYLYPWSRHWSQNESIAWLSDSVVAQFIYILITEVLIVAALVGLMRFLRWSRKAIGLVKPDVKHLLIGAGAFIPYLGLYIAIVAVVNFFVPSLDVGQSQEIGFDTASTPFELTLTFLSLVILPPLVEEIAMRGFLYSGLRTWLPKIVAAVVVSAVFGLAHLAEGGAAGPLWIGAIDTFALSLVLVGLREMTGNLWAGIVLHGLKNGLAFVLLFVLHVG